VDTHTEGIPYRFAGSITDVTEEKVYERKIFELAYYDPATMLPNRAHLYDKLQKMLNAGEQGILFLININNLITVNDIFGYHYGDILLRSMAERIVDALPETKLLGRLSGSDFVAILNAERAKEAMLLAEKLLASLNDPIELQGNKIRVSTNIGIALYPENGTSVTDILKNADAAMHYSRKDGRSRYEIFDRRMTEEIARNLKMENSLHDALVRDEFVLFYQPQIIVRDRSLSGFEGLIRWKTTPGIISPDKFIPLAEETGLIVPMGYGVLSKACAFIRRIEAIGTSSFKVSVNISTVQLLQADFVDQVMQIVGNSKVPINLVGLEITESALMKSYVSNVEKLEELRRNGIVILLDDFGTGYSSLNYLQSLPIDTLKIDKSFVDKIAEHQKARDLASTIISLAHKLGLNVVAEGIETEQQMRILEDNDCDIIQGYLFSKPLPEDLAFDYITPVEPGKK
jgi:diguanylate cyclase (GGDEF)-like protein